MLLVTDESFDDEAATEKKVKKRKKKDGEKQKRKKKKKKHEDEVEVCIKCLLIDFTVSLLITRIMFFYPIVPRISSAQ